MTPSSSATSRNAPGASRPALGMLPPDQRLEARRRAGRQRDDGLVPQAELLPLDRAAQFGLQPQPLRRRHRASRRRTRRSRRRRRPWRDASPRSASRTTSSPDEWLDALTATPMLGLTNTSCPPSEGLRRRARCMRSATRTASMGSLMSSSSTTNSSPPKRASVLGPAAVGLGGRQPASRCRRAGPRSPAARQTPQQLVAGGVAEAVVDVLEAIEVDEQHREV